MKKERTPEQKQLMMMKLQTAMIGLILLLILIFVLFLTVRVNDVMAILEQVDPVRLNQTAGSLKSAADQMAGMDVEALNAAISNIADAAGKLGDLDTQKLNSFMESLETLGTQMDRVSEVLKGLFR